LLVLKASFHFVFPKQHKDVLREKEPTHQKGSGAAPMAAVHPAGACACTSPTLFCLRCVGKGFLKWEEKQATCILGLSAEEKRNYREDNVE